MEALAKRLQGKVQFVFVYTQESHPDHARHAIPGSPVEVIPALSWTFNRAEREQRAREFRSAMKGSVRRILVDENGDSGGKTKVQLLYYMSVIGGRNFVIDSNRCIRAVADYDPLYKQLLEIFPEFASDLHENDAEHNSSDLPAGG